MHARAKGLRMALFGNYPEFEKLCPSLLEATTRQFEAN